MYQQQCSCRCVMSCALLEHLTQNNQPHRSVFVKFFDEFQPNHPDNPYKICLSFWSPHLWHPQSSQLQHWSQIHHFLSQDHKISIDLSLDDRYAAFVNLLPATLHHCPLTRLDHCPLTTLDHCPFFAVQAILNFLLLTFHFSHMSGMCVQFPWLSCRQRNSAWLSLPE